MINKKIVLGLVLAILMSVAMVSAVGAASTTKDKPTIPSDKEIKKISPYKKIDSGKIKTGKKSIAVFKTIANGKNSVIITIKYYTKNKNGKYDKGGVKLASLAKVNKNKLSICYDIASSFSEDTKYVKTGSSAVKYYKQNRSNLIFTIIGLKYT